MYDHFFYALQFEPLPYTLYDYLSLPRVTKFTFLVEGFIFFLNVQSGFIPYQQK